MRRLAHRRQRIEEGFEGPGSAQSPEPLPHAVPMPEFLRKRPPGDVMNHEIVQGFEKLPVIAALVTAARARGRKHLQKKYCPILIRQCDSAQPQSAVIRDARAELAISGEECMALLQRFDPPAFMTDLDHIKGGRQAWDDFMNFCFEWDDRRREAEHPPHQRQARHRPVLQSENLRRRHGDRAADPVERVPENLAAAVRARPRHDRGRQPVAVLSVQRLSHRLRLAGSGAAAQVANTTAWTRPLDEYCEWHVERDGVTGKIAASPSRPSRPSTGPRCSAAR